MDTAARLDRVDERLADLATAQVHTERAIAELATQMAGLAAAQQRTEEQLAGLAAAQARTEAQMAGLAAAQRRTEEQMAGLAAAQQRTEDQMRTLALWQSGETGRREGERFERHIVARALDLFYGGTGGRPGDFAVNQLLKPLLPPQASEHPLAGEAAPTLADLIWWKGGRVAVVEVSNVVDQHDVDRAHARAGTLQRGGADAVAVVIGNSWRDLDTRVRADMLRMAWYVNNEMSEPFIALRRLTESGE